MSKLLHIIEYYLPETSIDCFELDKQHPEWNVKNSLSKTGVRFLHHADKNESTTDMAEKAAVKVLEKLTEEETPDTLIVCTQTPDNLIPHCSAMLQDRLNLPNSTKCFDINLGCSGFGFGLSTAYSYVMSGLSERVLLVTVDNYSKIISPENKKCFLLFSDGACASLIEKPQTPPHFQFGTDGSRSKAIFCDNSGVSVSTGDASDSPSPKPFFDMDGYGVFLFTLGTIPDQILKLIEKSGLSIDEIDLFVLHQASHYVLDSIKSKLDIPDEKFVIDLEEVGNTTSSSIPIALKRAQDSGRLTHGDKVLIFGFGIGLSWSGVIFEW